MKILNLGSNLPDDKESVYWMNIKSISSSDSQKKNTLQLTVKTQIKLFYRPKGLSSKEANEAYSKLDFSFKNGVLNVQNPTPYFVSFYEVKVDGKELTSPGMVFPNSTLSFNITKGHNISWSAINDYGGITKTKSYNL